MAENYKPNEHPPEAQCVSHKRNGARCNNLAVLIDTVDSVKHYGTLCNVHSGHHQIKKYQSEQRRNYRLTQVKFRDRIIDFADNDKVKSLREDIGILRLLAEEKLNLCKDSADLMLQSATLTDIIMKIEKLVTACHKLETSTSQLLDRDKLELFANTIIEIITRNVKDVAKIDKMAEDIMMALQVVVTGEPVETASVSAVVVNT